MSVHAFTYTCVCVCVRDVCYYVYVVCVCRKRRGLASHGVFCGMSPLAPSQSHEMGKHEIKVEKTHKDGGKRMTRVWTGEGE